MSLIWEWKKQSGTITQKIGNKEQTFTWYEGNAMMIVLYEYTNESGEDMYQMGWFFDDEEHAKRCLGLVKGKDCSLEGITSLTIYRENSRQWEKITKLFTRAFPDIAITILPKAPSN